MNIFGRIVNELLIIVNKVGIIVKRADRIVNELLRIVNRVGRIVKGADRIVNRIS